MILKFTLHEFNEIYDRIKYAYIIYTCKSKSIVQIKSSIIYVLLKIGLIYKLNVNLDFNTF